jgi:REP element-mobilizing transposase RayT
MPRQLRIEYPGAIYHVMNRGDRREPIFHDDLDRKRFVVTLGEACAKTDWQVHAYCLMSNHFHLVMETPNANLVVGMRWFLGTYTARFNRRHKLFGHLFSGRYKSLIVDGSGNGYLRTVCDYVHLNPVRAKLLLPEQRVRDYAWSSWPEYLKPPEGRPRWLRVDRLLGELHIPQDSAAGQEQLEAYLEQRRTGEDGDELKGIRRGWCLGGETFRQELLEQARARAGENHHAQTRRESAEEKAQRIRQAELDKLGWREGELAQRDKGDAGKIRIARRLRSETSVPLKWIAEALKMGSWMYVASRLNRKKEVKGTNDQNQLNLV